MFCQVVPRAKRYICCPTKKNRKIHQTTVLFAIEFIDTDYLYQRERFGLLRKLSYMAVKC